jgi:hypothetical protein
MDAKLIWQTLGDALITIIKHDITIVINYFVRIPKAAHVREHG